MPDKEHLGDIHRFGLDNPFPPAPALATPYAAKVRTRFKQRGVRIRSSANGAVTGLYGTLSLPQSGASPTIASNFLKQNQDVLGIDPSTLKLVLQRQSGGLQHVLFQQTLNGLPVEFSRVKVHLSARGEVIGLASGYRYNLNLSPIPSVSEPQAAAAVGADLGRSVSVPGTLVYLPVYSTGQVRLAWKFHVAADHAVWDYYVDAQTGQVLFRLNELEFDTNGTFMGNVYDIDPETTPKPVDRPLPYQSYYVYNDPAGVSIADVNGHFDDTTNGKLSAMLQGKYVNVGHSALAPALYNNGSGVFCTAATALSSPHPYPAGTSSPNNLVYSGSLVTPNLTSTSCAGQTVMAWGPHFSTFYVGLFDPTAGIGADDQLVLLNNSGAPAASYIGNKGAFSGPYLLGPPSGATNNIGIFASPGSSEPGFDIDVSNVMVLTDPNPTQAGSGNVTPAGGDTTDVVWYSTMTSDGSEDEIMVYYHLNLMRNYYVNGVDSGNQADLSQPFNAMVRLGTGFANAFFDPDYGNIFFGDAINGAFALDASVIHHEYTHLVVSKIFPIFNFGQSGAMSEANADYFSMSSLGEPNMGAFVGGSFTSEGSLRDLDCSSNPSLCAVFPSSTSVLGVWTGEIHHDSLPLSQALWEVRTGAGQACADQLVFQSLFFFPEGFQEFLDAMLQVNAQRATLAPACGADESALIVNQFNYHGIGGTVPGADSYEPNDGPDTATNVSTMPVVVANIYPAADQDFYTFGAAAGPMQFTLNLPLNGVVQSAYMGYSMTLLDSQMRILAEAIPTLSNPTPGGGCPNGSTIGQMCQTASSLVQLNYNNPIAGQYYLMVSAGPTDDGSTSNANSLSPYTLHFNYVQPGVLSGSIVQATFDNDTISFNVNIAQYAGGSMFNSFAFAQLRDHEQNVLPQTATNGAAPYLTVVGTPAVSGGVLSGQVRLTPGFSSRFPAVGTVYLEIFGFNNLQSANNSNGVPGFTGLPQSLGLSNPLNLTASGTGLTAYNNIMTSPGFGRPSTFKWATNGSGHVTIKVYTINGVLVQTLIDGDYPGGEGSVDWNGRNSAGNVVASGVYIVHLDGPGISTSQKVIVVK